jgi:preprotein translocase subunit YajC
MLADTSTWGTVFEVLIPVVIFGGFLILIFRGTRKQNRYIEHNFIFMDRQEQLLERIAVALEKRAEK